MLLLETAKYLGDNLACCDTDGIWVSLTHYTSHMPNQSLHAHVNPHLTLLLRGGTVEKSRKGSHERKGGDIVFFPAGEPHQNSRTPPGSCNINFEFEPVFFRKYDITETAIHTAAHHNPQARFLLFRMYRELLAGDAHSAESINMLALRLVHTLQGPERRPAGQLPPWAGKVRELLHAGWNEPVSLQQLAKAAGVHPVTISKYFPLYFSCTLGEYMRRLKVERALDMVRHSRLPLLEIAYECGFADQSHFTRTFRELTGFLPRDFRKL